MITNIVFNAALNLAMFLSILYLCTSGQDYMTEMAIARGDSPLLDRFMLGAGASVCFIGVFAREAQEITSFTWMALVLLGHFMKLIINSIRWRARQKQNSHNP